MTNLFDLSDRLAVVTGSAQGMGRAMALALADAGANLVLLDRNSAGIEATAHSIQSLGRKALPIAGDVTATDHIDRVFTIVDREFGRVDILGNVAGEAGWARPRICRSWTSRPRSITWSSAATTPASVRDGGC